MLRDILTALIGYGLFEKSVDGQMLKSIDTDMLLSLYRLSSAHDVTHIIAKALSDLGRLGDDGVSEKFKNSMLMAVYRYEGFRHELDRICSALEKEAIPFIILKGSRIRSYYPEPWLRTSCDIDLLVHKEDLDRSVSLLMSGLGYSSNESLNYHDVSLFSPGGVHLELHYNIKENMPSVDPVLERVWENAERCSGCEYRYELSDEFLYFHLMAHTVYHFMHGGCGIKPFIDLFVLSRVLTLDAEGKAELLEQGGLRLFAEQAEKLSLVWFADREHTELTRRFERYVLLGGVYGTTENRIATQKVKKGGKLRYALSRIWLTRDQLSIRYPVLIKHGWLLPIYEVRRWFRAIFGGERRRLKKELTVLRASKSEADERAMKALLEGLGLN